MRWLRFPRAALGFFFFISCGLATASEWGVFEGRVVTKWVGERDMELIEKFAFVDSKGVRWEAPIGAKINGASIPRFAWSFIGGPYEGLYREASVIHDVGCDDKLRDWTRTWQATHEAFYHAMLANGVDGIKAKVMYAAVYQFGPRWEQIVTLPRIRSADVERAIATFKREAGPLARVDARVFAGVSGERVRMPAAGGFPSVNLPAVHPSTPVSPPSPISTPRLDQIENTVQLKSIVDRTMTEDQFAELKRQIETSNLSVEQIRAYRPTTR